jgi:2-C-methyl-D-erythritol 2,4-cyclodiphosphate synthase
VDALLGAAALGDIGDHFPNSDDRWRGEPSSTFLRESARLLAIHGWDVVNIDISVIAERPRLSGRRDEIRTVIAGLTGISTDHVSVKATTNEGLGSIGRGEGVAAFAVATIKRRV